MAQHSRPPHAPSAPTDAAPMSTIRYEQMLIEGLENPVPDVAATCAWVLGERRSLAAVAPLCTLLRQRADLDDVRVAAIESLAKIGDPAALPTLIEVARTAHLRVRLAAVVALRQFDPASTRAVLVERAGTDPSASVRRAASDALGVPAEEQIEAAQATGT